MRAKPKYFTRDLLVLFCAAVLIVTCFIVVFESSEQERSREFIHVAAQRAGSEFEAMVERVEASLGMVRDWAAAGTLDPSRPEDAKKLLHPFFGKDRMLSGISVADDKDAALFLLPDGTIRLPAKEKLYNPADRPWFNPALEQKGCHWTGIYRFYTLDEPGITASIAWEDKKGTKTVAAFDILLKDFAENVQQLAPTRDSRAFIFLPDGQLYVPGTDSTKSGLLSIASHQDQLLKTGFTLWRDNGLGSFDGISEDDDVDTLKVFRTMAEGRAWWCGFVPFGEAETKVWMAVFVPENDLVGDISKRRVRYTGIGSVVFIVVALIYCWIYWRSRRGVLINTDVDEARIRQLILAGENRAVEFKSTIRMNLHTKKPGKEIELAWLKGVAGFLNTDGGTLLLGVTDDGEITGIEQDVFENEDKCRLHFKNLVARHIGADFSKYIRFLLIPMDGKTVGVVLCARCSEPVFLKDGNKEHFYIRNGPSSDELPVSKALRYIKNRK